MTEAELTTLAQEVAGMEPAAKAILWAEQTGHVSPVVHGASDLAVAIQYLTRYPVCGHGFATGVIMSQRFTDLDECRKFAQPAVSIPSVKTAIMQRRDEYWLSLTAANQQVAWSESPSHPAESLEYGR